MEKPHKKLDLWKAAMELARVIYSITAQFPFEERFGLITQIRRAAVSIVSNIAEGAARQRKKEFRNFLRIAYGSGAELETQSRLAKRLNFTSIEDCRKMDELLGEVMRMLNVLIRNLRD